MSKWNRRQFLSGLLAATGAGVTSATYAEALSPRESSSPLRAGEPETSSPTASRPEGVSSSSSRAALARDGERHALHDDRPHRRQALESLAARSKVLPAELLDGLRNAVWFTPGENATEAKIAEFLAARWGERSST